MPISNNILNTLIKNQKDAIRYHFWFALIVLFIGITIMLISNFHLKVIMNNIALKQILTIGGGFISTIGVFPVTQIISRREKLAIYKQFIALRKKMSETEALKIEELIWKSVEKIF